MKPQVFKTTMEFTLVEQSPVSDAEKTHEKRASKVSEIFPLFLTNTASWNIPELNESS